MANRGDRIAMPGANREKTPRQNCITAREPRANRPNRNARPDARTEAKRCAITARPDARTEAKRCAITARPDANRGQTARQSCKPNVRTEGKTPRQSCNPNAQTEAKRIFSLVQPLKGVRRGGAASRFDSLAQTGAAARQDNTMRAVCQKAPRQIFPHCPASHGKAIECAGAANLHSPSFPRRVDKETESMRKADEPRIYARSSVMNDTKTAPPPSQ